MPDIQDRPADWKMDYSQMINVTGHDGTMLTAFASEQQLRANRRKELWESFRAMQREGREYLDSIGQRGLTTNPAQQQTLIDIETYGL